MGIWTGCGNNNGSFLSSQGLMYDALWSSDILFVTKTSVLKTGEPEPASFTGMMVDRFKPSNKPNRPAGL
jgi:hypothetical protein